MDRLSSISVFLSAAELGSFARAGNAIGVSGSAVSKSVSRLEDRLHVRLFHRTTRALSLTDEGREFRDRCTPILADLDDIEHQMFERSSAPSGLLRISLPMALGRIKIVPALGALTRQFPGLRIETLLNDAIISIVDAGIDAIVRIGEPSDSAMIMKRVGKVRYVTCAAPSYLASHGVPNTPQSLMSHDCLRRMPHPCSPKGTWKFDHPITKNAFEEPVSGSLSFDSADAVLKAAVAGSGVAQLHNYMVEQYFASGELVQVLDEFTAEGPPICILFPSTRHLAPKVRAFIDIVTHQLRDRARAVPATLAA